MRGFIIGRTVPAAVLACLLSAVAVAADTELVSTMRNVNAVGEAQGFRLNPAYDQAAEAGPDELAPVQAFEIIRPPDKAVTIGRLYTSCACVRLESPKRTFAPGERAILQLRNVKPTPTNGQVYAIYVQVTSPVRATLRFDTFVQSKMAMVPVDADAKAPAAPAASAAPTAAAADKAEDAAPEVEMPDLAANTIGTAPIQVVELTKATDPILVAEEVRKAREREAAEKEGGGGEEGETETADSKPAKSAFEAAKEEMEAYFGEQADSLAAAGETTAEAGRAAAGVVEEEVAELIEEAKTAAESLDDMLKGAMGDLLADGGDAEETAPGAGTGKEAGAETDDAVKAPDPSLASVAPPSEEAAPLPPPAELMAPPPAPPVEPVNVTVAPVAPPAPPPAAVAPVAPPVAPPAEAAEEKADDEAVVAAGDMRAAAAEVRDELSTAFRSADAAIVAPPAAPIAEKAGEGRIQTISLITIGVRDMARSVRFYEDLGWRRASRNKYDQTAFFQLNGQVLALYPMPELLKEQNMDAATPAPGGVTLALHVATKADVEALYGKFIAAGGTSLKAPTEMPSGAVTCYVADPDGNPWEISCVPQFRLDSEGGLWLP